MNSSTPSNVACASPRALQGFAKGTGRRWRPLARALSISLLSMALGACSSPRTAGPAHEVSAGSAATSKRAQAMERSAAQAYAQGDLSQAAAQFQALALSYTALAQTGPQALAWLNWARVQAELGQPAAAITAIRRVLTLESLPASVQTLAHGRLAALLIPSDTHAAAEQLAQAQALCQNCPEQSALYTLRAHLDLLQNDAPAAKRTAASAMQSAQSSADLANALRVSAKADLVMGPGFGALSNAIENTQKALTLDQGLGAASRVNADLDLLARLYQANGDTANARHHATLLRQAQEAQTALRAPLGVPASAPGAPARPAAATP